MIQCKVAWVFYANSLEEAAVCAKDVVALGFVACTQSGLGPCGEAAMSVALAEMWEEIGDHRWLEGWQLGEHGGSRVVEVHI